jgi:uncharacterized protein YkuJ
MCFIVPSSPTSGHRTLKLVGLIQREHAINTDGSRRKVKRIERAGVVTFVVQREEPPFRYVTIEAP